MTGDPALTAALSAWKGGSSDQQTTWARTYSDALAGVPDGDPAKVAAGSYGPVPVLAASFLTLADSGGLEGLLTSSSTFYVSNETKPLLLLAEALAWKTWPAPTVWAGTSGG